MTKTFAPDFGRIDGRDVQRYLTDLAGRAGAVPGRMGTDPRRHLLHELAVQAAAGGAVKVKHNLTKQEATGVREAIHASLMRLRAEDSPYRDVALRLLTEWEQHVRWTQGDARRREPDGPSGEWPDEPLLSVPQRAGAA